MLVGKTTLPMDMGENIFMSPTPIRVRKGDIIGIHVDDQGEVTTGIGMRSDCLEGNILSPEVSAMDNGWMNNFVLDVSTAVSVDQCVSLSAICVT